MRKMAETMRSPEEHFTYGDYRRWPDEERWELIEGRAYSMCAAPTRRHQDLNGRLYRRLGNFLEAKPCRVYSAPFDVLFPEGEEDDEEVDTVLEPDIVVFCDRTRLRDYGARGAPDLVVEILSPSTSKKDQREKFDLYERHGVKEYWVVDPEGRWLCVYRLDPAGKFDVGELREPLGNYGPLASRLLEGFSVDPRALFADLD